MGEIERRRRRLRPPSSASTAAETSAGRDAPAMDGGSAGQDNGQGGREAQATHGGYAGRRYTATPERLAAREPRTARDTGAQETAVGKEGNPDAEAARAVRSDTAPDADAETRAIEDPVEEPGRPVRATRGRPVSGAGVVGDESERGLRGLVGSGSSQVSVGAALRARDAARPTEDHLADAEANLTIVRRNWTPREELPRTR
jgi:hypothetical protein